MPPPFPAPSERTPGQHKIARVVNDAVIDADEVFCNRIYDRLTQKELESDDVIQAILLLAPDFADVWENNSF